MIKGLYSAVSAMVMNANRQEILSHNIANMQTPGFKTILTTVEDFMNTPVVYSPGASLKESTLDYIGRLGLGVKNGIQMTDFSQGALLTTGNQLDMALQAEGFFTVSTPDGIRYTRDGRFLRDAQSTLSTVEGYPVLAANGQPIRLPDGDISVGPDGTLYSGTTVVAKLGIATFKDPEQELVRTRGNLFSGPAQSTGQGAAPQVVQGALEGSNANPTTLMADMTEIVRSYEMAQKMVQNEDELTGKTIASLGRTV
jgi:flagellar basal-body rod protein FlgF